jgi:hypothetical protein
MTLSLEGPRETPIPEPFWKMLSACADYCVIDCCGTNALDVSVPNVRAWVDKVGAETARLAANQIEALCREVAGHAKRVTSLTDVWENREFLEWLRQCQVVLLAAFEDSSDSSRSVGDSATDTHVDHESVG